MTVPAPVPGLPDAERRTAYSIAAQTGPFSVGFDVYGDSTDYGEWVEVWLDGVQLTAVTVWFLTSPSGSVSSLPRPITDAVITLAVASTGTLEIVGARRPRRTNQFTENRGVAARDLNQVITDVVAQLREMWDRTRSRMISVPAGEVITQLPFAASRANKVLAFNGSGDLIVADPSGPAGPAGPGRPVLTADRNYYVRTNGSDSNNGLANTAVGAFLTIQKAIDTALTLDCAGFQVTINVADGIYTGPAKVLNPALNIASLGLFLLGNQATPANCIISTTGADAISAFNGAHVRTHGFTVRTTTIGNGVSAYSGAFIEAETGMAYGACADSQINASTDATVSATQNYTINGNATSHWHAGAPGSRILLGGQTITLTGTPAFSSYFAGLNGGMIVCNSVTFAGGATGQRYVNHIDGALDLGNNPITFLPGNVGGVTYDGATTVSSTGDLYDPAVPWKSQSQTITASVGVFTSVAGALKYKVDGTTFKFQLTITVTTVGSAATAILFTLPTIATNNTSLAAINKDTGQAAPGYIPGGSNAAILIPPTFPLNGHHIYLTGEYEIGQQF